MYTIKSHPIINHIIKVLQMFGVWQKDNESVYLTMLKKTISLIILVSLFASLSSGVYISEDMNESIYLSAATVASALMVIKLVYVLSKQKEVHKFLNEICVHSVVDVEEQDAITVKLNNFARFGYINVFSMLLSILLFIILSLPFFSSEKRLPLNIGFPLDWKNSAIGYWLAHTFVITAVILAMIVTFFTIIYWYIMFNCSIQYKLLGNRLRQFGSRKVVVEDLVHLIKTHRNIQELVFDLMFYRDSKRLN